MPGKARQVEVGIIRAEEVEEEEGIEELASRLPNRRMSLTPAPSIVSRPSKTFRISRSPIVHPLPVIILPLAELAGEDRFVLHDHEGGEIFALMRS
jgi:hypothetical protein